MPTSYTSFFWLHSAHPLSLSSRPCTIELPTAISSSSFFFTAFSFLLTPIPTSSKAVTTSNVFLLEYQVNYLPLSLIVNSFQLLFLSILHTISLVFLALQEQWAAPLPVCRQNNHLASSSLKIIGSSCCKLRERAMMFNITTAQMQEQSRNLPQVWSPHHSISMTTGTKSPHFATDDPKSLPYVSVFSQKYIALVESKSHIQL